MIEATNTPACKDPAEMAQFVDAFKGTPHADFDLRGDSDDTIEFNDRDAQLWWEGWCARVDKALTYANSYEMAVARLQAQAWRHLLSNRLLCSKTTERPTPMPSSKARAIYLDAVPA